MKCRAIVRDKNLVVCSVLSGNRNFEGRIQQDVRANYLASPPLVVAYALAGWITKDLTTRAARRGSRGQPGLPEGHLAERAGAAGDDAPRGHRGHVPQAATPTCSQGDERWKNLPGAREATASSGTRLDLYPQADVPRRHDDDAAAARPTSGARVLALLGDSVTTDHISPAGSIKADSPAGQVL